MATSKNILDEARATIKQIDIDEARRMLDKPGTVLVDVRESDEWRQGHIPQAVGIPRGFLELRIEEKVPDHKTPVVLQCASGTRSLLAARTLREMGYENLYNLTGGFNAWKDRGLPLRRTSSPATRATSSFPKSARRGKPSCSIRKC
jgi:rhodanese-related sulfurtransferase